MKATTTGPLVPPAPPKEARKRTRSGLRPWQAGLAALVLGAAFGVVAYEYVPGIDTYFDYWIALALS